MCIEGDKSRSQHSCIRMRPVPTDRERYTTWMVYYLLYYTLVFPDDKEMEVCTAKREQRMRTEKIECSALDRQCSWPRKPRKDRRKAHAVMTPTPGAPFLSLCAVEAVPVGLGSWTLLLLSRATITDGSPVCFGARWGIPHLKDSLASKIGYFGERRTAETPSLRQQLL